MTEEETQEFQSNLTAIRNLKRSIQKARHPAQFATAMITFISIKIISRAYEGIPVAILPFKPLSIFDHFISYQLDSNTNEDSNTTFMSAPFLYFLVFVALKVTIRKSIFVKTARLGQRTIGVSIPRSMLMKQNGIM